TALVNRRAAAQQPHVTRTVNVVAGGALHLTFAYRHVAEPILAIGDRLVARRAQFHFVGLGQHRRALRIVNAVAGYAAHVALVVLTPIPQRMRTPVVARRADLTGLLRPHLVRIANQRRIATLGVRLARSVTAFAPMRGRRARPV